MLHQVVKSIIKERYDGISCGRYNMQNYEETHPQRGIIGLAWSNPQLSGGYRMSYKMK